MLEIELTADELVTALLGLEKAARLALLDSCGRTLGDSRYLIAGVYPTESFEFRCQTQTEAFAALEFLDEKLAFYASNSDCSLFLGGGFGVATLTYEFGLLFEDLTPRPKEFYSFDEPSATFRFYETFAIHDYATKKTFIVGKNEKELAELLYQSNLRDEEEIDASLSLSFGVESPALSISSNFSQKEYLAAVQEIQRHIALGDVYQANLTQQLRVNIPDELTPEQIFRRVRAEHPAPFAAFVRRESDCLVSASPERFLKVETSKEKSKVITASPIKGTRRRGKTPQEDLCLRSELTNSAKDQAENLMIVDLLRNDIGRVCEFGSVKPVKLCEVETHETLFHLVSTIRGNLRPDLKTSDLLKATFPCGSITGAPKIRAMQILDRIETAPRGSSMGAIGYLGFNGSLDLNVAIRTMVVRDQTAIFNVGGGIVFDSQPIAEYEESLVKAKALLAALGVQKLDSTRVGKQECKN